MRVEPDAIACKAVDGIGLFCYCFPSTSPPFSTVKKKGKKKRNKEKERKSRGCALDYDIRSLTRRCT